MAQVIPPKFLLKAVPRLSFSDWGDAFLLDGFVGANHESLRMWRKQSKSGPKLWGLLENGAALSSPVGYRSLPSRPIPGRPDPLSAEDEEDFVAPMQESPNWTLVQFQQKSQEKLGVFCPIPRCTTMSNAWQLDIKKSRQAFERCEVKWAVYQEQVAKVPLEKLVGWMSVAFL